MINADEVLAEAKELFVQILAKRDGISPESILPLGNPSPGLEALGRALIAAINKELTK